MPMPFDATLKDLLRYTSDWLLRLGVETHAPIEEVAADLSSVTAAADKVFRIGELPPWLLHLEMQSSRDGSLPRRALKYNVLLHELFTLPVHTVVVLLRREADEPGLTGVVEYQQRPELGGMRFTYRVVQAWEWPLAELIDGGLGTLPLAMLSAEVTEAALPRVVQRMGERLHRIEPGEAAKLWTATLILSGLRFPLEIIAKAFQGVSEMKESVTYQAIVEEGEVKGIRETLLEIATCRLGAPTAEHAMALGSITDKGQLRRMSKQIVQVNSWQELLAIP